MSATLVIEAVDESVIARIQGQLDFLDVALMALEKDRGDSTMLKQFARSIQSIRAACRNWSLSEMELLACELCEWLDHLRDVPVELTDEQIRLLQRCAMAFQAAIAAQMLNVPVPESLQNVSDEVRRAILWESQLITVS